MSRISSRLNGTVACLALFAGAFLAGPAAAQQIAANIAPNTSGAGEIETVVVTGTEFNPDVAPAKASLQTMEPQTIINRSYIEDSVADTADYTTILGIAPSMTGFSTNGPGLSDGDVKNTMRGLPDGSYGMTYDGIPFGDTNGPSHHSESYFPGPTIGSIDVDRGPGNAGNLGAATFGGSVNMLSEVLTPDSSVRTTFTYGSWNTTNFDVRWQSGDLGRHQHKGADQSAGYQFRRLSHLSEHGAPECADQDPEPVRAELDRDGLRQLQRPVPAFERQ